MNEGILVNFMTSVTGNPKILPSHISLFSAIVCCKENFGCSFNVSRRRLMELSKIRSTATYHKCMRDLVTIGYLEYDPSFHPVIGSKVRSTC